MDAVIEFLGRDTFVILVLFIAVNIRAGKPEKVPVFHGFALAFPPFFIVLCILYIFEWVLGWFSLVIPALPLASVGGLFGFLGNSWIAGLTKNGKTIEEEGALGAFASLVKSILTFKKTTP
ncbi:hypothetical protein GCM10028808_73350 [Spirosoma migulaei]